MDVRISIGERTRRGLLARSDDADEEGAQLREWRTRMAILQEDVARIERWLVILSAINLIVLGVVLLRVQMG